MQHQRIFKADELIKRTQDLMTNRDLKEAERTINALFNQIPSDPNVVYLLGTLEMHKGNYMLAALVLNECVKLAPNSPSAWNNLGISFKHAWIKDKAAICFEKAAKLDPHPDFWSNLAGCYVNEGNPDECLKHAEKALEIDPKHVQGRWHKALSLLELQKWDKAWDYYESRLEEGADLNIAVRNYAEEGMTPWWDGKSKGLVVVHGEQGLGDEVMFASCLKDAIKTGAELVLECSPRMTDIFARSFPEIKVFGTHKLDGSEWRNGRKVDYKIGLGSLPKFFRRKESDFPGTPYLKVDERKSRHWRKMLSQLGDKPKIGIAWQGGVHMTRVELRSLMPEQLQPILANDATFISLQYTKQAYEECKDYGIIHWKEAAEANNMDDFAALVANLDMVVSVCQTAIHFAGALGIPCLCLTPSRPAWRYGVVGNMPWYNSVDLIRQEGDDWNPVIQKTASLVKARLLKAA